MTSDSQFHIARIRGSGNSWPGLWAALQGEIPGVTGPAGGHLWGAFYGLFGLASNELLLVTAWRPGSDPAPIEALVGRADGAELADQEFMVPTVRPLDDAPRTRPGLYVFRWFDVRHRDVDRIAELSREAWETFEAAESYAAEPQGLWRQKDTSAETGRMLLLTWYDGLNSWGESRRPPPEAAANFRERRKLTARSLAVATRLIVD